MKGVTHIALREAIPSPWTAALISSVFPHPIAEDTMHSRYRVQRFLNWNWPKCLFPENYLS